MDGEKEREREREREREKERERLSSFVKGRMSRMRREGLAPPRVSMPC